MSAPTSYSSKEIHAAIDRLAASIAKKHSRLERILLLAVANGGLVLCQRLAALLDTDRTGILDISFHRDDIERNPIPKEYAPTQVPFDLNHATVILVDDVLYSGRTIKAALDELFDLGRPQHVGLAVLFDRGGRKLPLHADHVGIHAPIPASHHVRVFLSKDAPHRDEISIAPLKPSPAALNR